MILWSSELNEEKSGKSRTLRLIQSVRAYGRNNVYWWLNLEWSWVHNSVGSFTCKYWRRREWCKWRRNNNKVCHLHAEGIWTARFVEVITKVVIILAKSSAVRTVLASLTHSRKFDPSELRRENINACIMDSTNEGCVERDYTNVCLLAMMKVSRS